MSEVRAAGLESVLSVPLLATVAAEVFQARGDRRLPSTRYQLYENYIALFTAGRAEIAAAAPDRLEKRPETLVR